MNEEYSDFEENDPSRTNDVDKHVMNLYSIVTRHLNSIEDVKDNNIYEIVESYYSWADYKFIIKIRDLFNLINQEERNVYDDIINKDFYYDFVILFYQIIDIIIAHEDIPDYIPADTVRKDTTFNALGVNRGFGEIVYKYDFYFEAKLVKDLGIDHELNTDHVLLLPSNELVIPLQNNNLYVVNPLTKTNLDILEEHTDFITDMAVTPTGFVSCSANGELVIWDLQQQTHIIVDADTIYMKCVMCIKNMIVSGSDEGDVTIWDLEGNMIATLPTGSSINVLTQLNDNTIVIGNDKILIWNYITKKVVELKDHTRYIDHIVISNDKLISSSRDETIKIWNLKTYAVDHTIEDIEPVYKLLVHNNQIIVAHYERTNVTVFDFEGNLLRTLFTYVGEVESILILPDERIAIGYGDTTNHVYSLKIWNSVADVPDIVIWLGDVPASLFMLKDGSLTCVTQGGYIVTWT